MKTKLFPFLAYTLLVLSVAACSDDDFNDSSKQEPDNIEFSLAGIEELISAHDNGKTISNILFISSSGFSSDPGDRWLITFTDGSSINLFNHPDFTTPYLRVSNEGLWNVAYDGKSFNNLKGNNGGEIKALSQEIDPENPLQEEIDILCLSPSLDINGNLYYNSYLYSSPESILDSFTTTFSLPEDTEIFSIVQNDFTGSITFYFADSDPLQFPYKNRWPYSFGILESEETLFKAPGDSVTIEFFVSPADIDFKLDTDDPLLELKLVYLNGTDAINYSGYPVTLKEITKAKDDDGKVIPGRYNATLEDIGDNLFTYDQPVTLSLSYIGVDRENLSLSSPVFNVSYDSDSPLIIESEIPVIKIKAPSAITSKDIWTEDCEIEFLNSGKYDKSYSKVQLKGRGNSTWILPKKPYAIKLDKKEEVLGFPKHKRWVLLANYYDLTNIRNEIAFFMGRMSKNQPEPGLDYTPRSSFVRLFFNDNFQGLYQLTEQLKVDDNRVNVGDGYLLEIDFRAKEEAGNIYFRIPHIDIDIVVKDPDIESRSDLDFIKEYMNRVDDSLFSNYFLDPDKGYRNYINVNSFADWYLINEITKNCDSNFWTSCYMNFSRDGKLNMGPLWDFDLAAGGYPNFGDYWFTQWINDPKDFHVKTVKFYSRLFQDPEFVKTIKQRFQFYYDRQNEIYEEIDKQRELIAPVIEENEKIWFFFGKPFDFEVSTKTFYSNCESLKSWLQQRFDWLKKEFDKM